MKLSRFRVIDFRSIEDSGWVNTDDITTLVGTNESGKTNLMLPLWKLNPTEETKIDILQDMPRRKYHSLRNAPVKPIFITADFALSDDERKKLAELAPSEDTSRYSNVFIGKDYSSHIFVEFTDSTLDDNFIGVITDSLCNLMAEIADERYANIAEKIENVVGEILPALDGNSTIFTLEQLTSILTQLATIDNQDTAELESLRRLKILLAKKQKCVSLGNLPAIKDYILATMPKFVYYSSYGNIDSEIYLPQVIQNFQRDNLGVKEAAKVRTLKMLFNFVKLDPIEIHELGKESTKVNLTEDQIAQFTKQKKEREILLQSAATEFTTRFRNWWKQGNYTFDFQADGDFFRIWVSDDVRSDKIELESRSTGLQWFFSCYLTFLTQSENKSQTTILLLDEPGLTLHPLAQEDLFAFFENLCGKNQIVYSTHSPYMVNPEHLSRIVSVYVDKKGNSVVSCDLRNSFKISQVKSVYPVHSALNMLISSETLNGCIPVIVDNLSDQIYLNTIKNILIQEGIFRCIRDVVFIPSGNVDGIKAVLPILVGKNAFVPYVVLSSTPEAKAEALELLEDTYKLTPNRVITLDMLGIENGTMEDLLPTPILEKIIVRHMPKSPYAEEEFEDVMDTNTPIMQQVLDFAAKYELEITKEWKELLARKIKAEVIKRTNNVYKEEPDKLKAVATLFEKLGKLM